MHLTLRTGQVEDAQACGIICFNAFKSIAEQHNFPPDFPVPEITIGLLTHLLADPHFYSVVAETEGRIIGSNFLREGGMIAGVGPITVDPERQNAAVGRKLMEHVLQRATERQFAGVRLVQAAYHNRSLSLYTKLGFDIREPLSVLQGPAIGRSLPGYAVRLAIDADVEDCNLLCTNVHGHHRGQELLDGIKQGTAQVVEHSGKLTGYTTGLSFLGHSVAETNNELQALIGAATNFPGPGFLLPTRNSKLLRWCLSNGLRITQPMTLMSMGLYNEPGGAFLPSILF